MNLMNKISRGNIEVCTSPQFVLLSAIISSIKHRIDEDAHYPVAATNGLEVMWNKDAVAAMPQKQLNWVIVHEAAHIFLSHLKMWKFLWAENAKQANIAADLVINNFIEEVDPNHSVTERCTYIKVFFDPKFAGMNTREVFDAIGQDPNYQKQIQSGVSFDVHDFKELTQEELKKIEIAKNIGMQRAQMSGKMNIKVPENDDINWEELLAQWVMRARGNGDNADWSRPNRRHIGRGIYFPTRRDTSLKEAVVAIDVSGSTASFVDKFAGYCKSLLDQCKIDAVHVIYWDDGVQNHEVYRNSEAEDYAEKTNIIGGGGTAFGPVLKYLEEQQINPAFMIGMTDAYLNDWGNDPGYPVIWINTTKEPIPYGEVINVTI